MTVRTRLRTIALVLAAASASMLGFAYFAEYQLGLLPCLLCLYQRPPHFVAVALALIAAGFVRGPKGVSRVFLALTALALLWSFAIAGYHAGDEWHFWPGPAECSGGSSLALTVDDLDKAMRSEHIVECDKPAWVFLGLSMAGWNCLISLGLAILAIYGMLQGQLRRRFRA